MKRKFTRYATFLTAALAVLVLVQVNDAQACTSFLVTKGASTDGSTMVTYSADSHDFYGELYFIPAGKHLPGTMLKVHNWEDSWENGRYTGEIPQVEETFQVVGNMNEHQLAISETTFTGRTELINPEGILDYGSLIYITLQRAKTAREAIQVMTDLVTEHGYHSSGESFSIADPNEVWILEMIGKGPGNKGAVWVGRMVPDGYVSAHANHSRIRQFPLNDKKNTVYSPDVISFAREKGFFKGAKDSDFSFADAYAPANFMALRACELRVWSFFRRVSPSLNMSSDYAKGVEGAEPMPLWIKPDNKLSVHDVMELMRDHFQDSEFYLGNGLGAGPFNLPYRWRPMTWEVDGVEYLHERSASTQQTGFSFVSQSRAGLPDPVGGILWFGVDDTYSTVYVPMYAGIKAPPYNFAVGTGSFTQFDWDAAFWVFNAVANLAYTRYSDIIQDVQLVQRQLEGGFMANQAEVEAVAVKLYEESPGLARDYLTEYSDKMSKKTVTTWRNLWQSLFVKYMDGNVRDNTGKVTHPDYSLEWRRRIVADEGERLLYKKMQVTVDMEAEEAAARAAEEAKLLKDKCAPVCAGGGEAAKD